ncbi:hypothetical protein M9194_04515 [Vibrio sp. S4M6]|uniref:hypothetical protein n=1 Tax=Vibrio sinus TaxID=2946865 RepID=UPI00202A9270|nr:hypothetical protein [Vibrio sinus]MCL9780700.1 hypothetical protein [Vibrio sinus]
MIKKIIFVSTVGLLALSNAYAGTITLSNQTQINMDNIVITLNNLPPLKRLDYSAKNSSASVPLNIDSGQHVTFSIPSSVGRAQGFEKLEIKFKANFDDSNNPYYDIVMDGPSEYCSDFNFCGKLGDINSASKMIPGSNSNIFLNFIGFSPVLNSNDKLVLDRNHIVTGLSAFTSNGEIVYSYGTTAFPSTFSG